MLERGYTVRLLTDGGELGAGVDGALNSRGGESADAAGVLLDTLAVIDHSERDTVSAAYDVLRGGHEGLLVAFFGDLDEEQAALAARMRQRTAAGVAFVADSAAWEARPGAAGGAYGAGPGGGAEGAERMRQLREAGWTVLSVRPGMTMGDLWREAGNQAGQLAAAARGGEG